MIKELFDAINQELIRDKLQHVQVLFRLWNGQKAMKFVSVDTPVYKEKIKAIAGKYYKDLYLVDESKTTLTYKIHI